MNSEFMVVNPQIGLKKAMSKLRNVVIIEARNFQNRKLCHPVTTHNGTMGDMVEAAMWLSSEMDWHLETVSHVNSRIIGIDAVGKQYAISPNGKHLAEMGTPEAASIWGEIPEAPVVNHG